MLEVKDITKVYGDAENRVVALDSVSLIVPDGGFLAITGASGSGKTTLLNIIGGLDRPTSGEVLLDSRRIDNLTERELVDVRRRRITNVFQHFHLLPSLTALENVLLPAAFCDGNTGYEESALDLLTRVGLGKRAHHRPAQLSGGEQQRVAIARAVLLRPSIILADEPTGNMDEANGLATMELFEELNRDGLSIIVVTHNPDVARRAHQTIVLKDGRVLASQSAQERVVSGGIAE
jgi:putative ABC transport system ATP-binding protein